MQDILYILYLTLGVGGLQFLPILVSKSVNFTGNEFS